MSDPQEIERKVQEAVLEPFLREVVQHYPEMPDEDRSFYRQTWYGSVSIIAAAALAALSVDDLQALLEARKEAEDG